MSHHRVIGDGHVSGASEEAFVKGYGRLELEHGHACEQASSLTSKDCHFRPHIGGADTVGHSCDSSSGAALGQHPAKPEGCKGVEDEREADEDDELTRDGGYVPMVRE